MAVLSSAKAEIIGNVDVDWLGNDIVVEALSDPKVKGVTCHLAYFDRGLIDRLERKLVRGPFKFFDLLPSDRTD